MLAWVVDMASSVVTPSATRAGTCRYHVDMCRYDKYRTALWSSQKESQDTDTVMEQGMYTCTLGTPSVGELNKLFTLGSCYYDMIVPRKLPPTAACS